MPTTENTKNLHPGISVWIFDEERSWIIGVDIVEELQDGFWKCARPVYAKQTGLCPVDPELKFFVRHESVIFRKRDEILDHYAAEARSNLSRRSYEHQIRQEENKEAYEIEYFKHCARKPPEAEESVEWHEGDQVWFYDDNDELVKDGTIVGTDNGDGLWLIEHVYIRSDHELDRDRVARAEGEMWRSAEAAADSIAKDLRDEILRNSIGLYDEQEERKSKSQPEVENA